VLTLENLDHRLKVVEELDMRVTRLEEKDGAGGEVDDLWTELGAIKGYCRDLLGEGFTNGVVLAKAAATIQKIWSEQEIHSLRLDRIDTRLDRIDTRLDRVDTRFDGIDGRLDRIDTRFDGIDGRFDHLETDVAQMKGSLAAQDQRFDQVDAVLREILDRLPTR
jgi:chromosome segregation ATPase